MSGMKLCASHPCFYLTLCACVNVSVMVASATRLCAKEQIKEEKCEVVDCIHVLLSGVIISEVEQSRTT